MRLICLILIFVTVVSQAQEDNGYSVNDRYYDYVKCLQQNNILLFDKNFYSEDKNDFNDINDWNEVYSIFNPSVKAIIDKSITMALSKIERIKKEADNEIKVSLHLTFLFSVLFEREVASFYDLQKCESNNDYGYIDYQTLLQQFLNIASKIMDKEIEKVYGLETQEYYFYDLLFKAAILNNYPRMKEYVEIGLLIKKYKYIKENDIFDETEYIYELADCLSN